MWNTTKDPVLSGMTRVAQSFADLRQKADRSRAKPLTDGVFTAKGWSVGSTANNCCREEKRNPPTSSILIPTTTGLGVTILNKPPLQPPPPHGARLPGPGSGRLHVPRRLGDSGVCGADAGEHPNPPHPWPPRAGDGEGRARTRISPRLGSVAHIEQLVRRFYALMDNLPEAAGIRAMHGPDLAPVKAVLVRFSHRMDRRPQAYSAERGHPRLRRKHLPFAIGAAERDAWMACATGALDGLVSTGTEV